MCDDDIRLVLQAVGNEKEIKAKSIENMSELLETYFIRASRIYPPVTKEIQTTDIAIEGIAKPEETIDFERTPVMSFS